ncbi:MAG: tetratricopeptide repeat protein [Muribaculaceae bacterium]|nr:tetratricopeptide repeat protein [Muribaculaceae bacterium]MDE6541892.1 tetratricopeptide repeat protein [Muribaculaceae bacterium]
MENPEINPATGDELIAKAKANKGKLVGALVFCIVVVVAALAWFFINQSGSAKADELVGKADVELNDSIAMQLYQEAAEAGHKSGNRAKLEVAIRYYNDGKYEDALKYLNDADISDKIVAAGALCLKGDCLVNLDRPDEALKAYKAAISKCGDENAVVAPFALIKMANIYREQKNYKDEYAAYKQIVERYPSYQYSQGQPTDFRKYMERARIAAGE